MALSERGHAWADMASNLLIWEVLKNLWDPQSNPGGYVSLGVAENALMHQELTEYLEANLKVPSSGLTYGDGSKGSHKLRSAMARFLSRKLKPLKPIESEHICITNGVSSAIEHISSLLANSGDIWLLGQPFYGAFIPDLELRTGCHVHQVTFEGIDPLSLSAVSAYEQAIKICQSKNQRVAGLMLCNPHNPLGRCYPRGYIVELMKLCQKHGIHLVSDEIYALSVFRSEDADSASDPSAIPFTSLSSIPTDGLIDPALTHILYGMSKDFGANGLRLGAIISQHNPELHKALTPLAIYSYASSLSMAITTTLLSDDKWIDWYIAENNRRLATNYDLVVKWAEKHGIEYAKGVNAAFFLWVDLGQTYRDAVTAGRIQPKKASANKPAIRRVGGAQEPPEPVPEERMGNEEDVDTLANDALLEQRVFLASGVTFGSERPGWFRIVFSQNKRLLEEGLGRVEKAFGL